MKRAIIFIFCYALLLCWDCIAYGMARYPERAGSVFYKLPLGGIIALIKFGR